MKLVFMGTPHFARRVLEILLASHHSVVGLICQPDKARGRDPCPTAPAAKTLALDAELPVFQPNRLGASLKAFLEETGPDAIVVAAYGKFIPSEFLSYGRFGCLNVHPSLLPRYRGAAPVQWALMNGEAQTGVSIMKLDAGMDTGPIILQRREPIREDDTGETLMARLAELGGQLMVEALDGLESGALSPIPQGEEGACLAPLLTREDGRIRWAEPGRVTALRIRAFHPWPGSYAFLSDGRSVKLFPPVTFRPLTGHPSGCFCGLEDGVAWFSCGDVELGVAELQLEGRCRIAAEAYVCGARWQPGLKLA